MTDKVIAADTSPEALLKQAVRGAEAKAQGAAAPVMAREKSGFRLDPRLAGVAGGALALGLLVGASTAGLVVAHGDRATDTIAQIQARFDAGRSDTERSQAQLDRIGKSLSQVQEGAEAARTEARTRNSALTERITRSEQALTAKIAALGEKLEQAEKDHAARIATLAAQAERRTAPQVSVPVASAAPATKATAPEPTTTGTIAEKPKSTPADNWAVREVYDGIAMLEDRKRRLVEVGPGDTVPGVGRVEAIERRGKAWAVVTRQGIITPQTW